MRKQALQHLVTALGCSDIAPSEKSAARAQLKQVRPGARWSSHWLSHPSYSTSVVDGRVFFVPH